MNWFSRLLGKGGDDADEALVIVPIPPLITLLQQHEAAKGSPLTEAEVLGVRDNAICMTMHRSRAESLAESRGFHDIEAANVWKDWLRVRSQGTA